MVVGLIAILVVVFVFSAAMVQDGDSFWRAFFGLLSSWWRGWAKWLLLLGGVAVLIGVFGRDFWLSLL